MKPKPIIFSLFLLIVLSQFFPAPLSAKRVVTMAPALTEIVFALGQGDSIVGNTNYCNFPEAAKKVQRVGGLMDLNLEVMVKLEPDVIFLYPENYEKLKFMKEKAELVVLKHADLEDLFVGITTIAKTLDVEPAGRDLVKGLKDDLHKVKGKVKTTRPLKVLLIISRNPEKLTNMYIIGKGDFLNQVLEIAGGVNAYSGDIRYPSISVESVAAMNPDVILELSATNEKIAEEKIQESWKKLPFISAVKNQRIHIVDSAMWVIPGPRVPRIAEEMHRILFGGK